MSASKKQFDDLAMALFKKFARFEYALKVTSFHCGNGKANSDWQKFSRSIQGFFEKSENNELRSAIQYFLDHPPKKQVIRNNQIDWEEANPGSKIPEELILLYVRRVRNNLFHGGKFHGHWVEPQRDINLLKYSLVILDACLQASNDVREAFKQDSY
ncbi:MAG: hypothetical protein WD407_03675 [Rhodospirillales bacterium]